MPCSARRSASSLRVKALCAWRSACQARSSDSRSGQPRRLIQRRRLATWPECDAHPCRTLFAAEVSGPRQLRLPRPLGRARDRRSPCVPKTSTPGCIATSRNTPVDRVCRVSANHGSPSFSTAFELLRIRRGGLGVRAPVTGGTWHNPWLFPVRHVSARRHECRLAHVRE